MAGLSNFIANQEVQQTTLPSWMDTAQQAVVNQATSGVAAMPSLQNTVAGNAINTLSGSNNPFTQAQGTLNTIASGAANPWLTSASGEVTPNVNTPMGGLFAAQNQQLKQLAPNIMDPVTAGGTASGQFGSLRTKTAADKAIADAQSKLFADQMQAALESQKTGVSAAGTLGNVGQQNITSATTLGQLQQTDPALKAATLGKIIGGVAAPQTVTASTNVSPLNQIGAIARAANLGVGGLNSLLGSIFPKGLSGTGTGPLTVAGIIGAGGLAAYNALMKAFGGSEIPTGSNAVPGTYPLTTGGYVEVGSNGFVTINQPNGDILVFDKDQNLVNSTTQQEQQDQQVVQDQENGSGGGGGGDTGGGNIDLGGGGDTGGGNIDLGGGDTGGGNIDLGGGGDTGGDTGDIPE